MKRTRWAIISKHASYPLCDGLFVAEVNMNTETRSRFVSIDGFGTSRDYHVATDEEAIRKLLAEHGARLEQAKAV